ncbi:MAG: peptide deformylase [Rhodospirillales bacterium]|nr:peptide deformylase [Rhodospirillales bacterium]MCB9965674.1 peptide deformylase [Rhodospirillales bacterium]
MTQPYEIITIPDPVLKATAHAVGAVTPEIQRQIDRMKATLDKANGIGLAANQVNILNRVLIVDVPEGIWQFGPEKNGVLTIDRGPLEEENPARSPVCMVNPEIIWQSEQKSVYEEGCLSIPNQYANVIRPAHVKVKYIDERGTAQEIECSGLHSHCVQHEIDHLNGVLFIDHLSSLKRNMIVKKFRKQNRVL